MIRLLSKTGYHVDLPIYRKVEETNWLGSVTSHSELTITDWKRSDARNVSEWFEKQND